MFTKCGMEGVLGNYANEATLYEGVPKYLSKFLFPLSIKIFIVILHLCTY